MSETDPTKHIRRKQNYGVGAHWEQFLAWIYNAAQCPSTPTYVDMGMPDVSCRVIKANESADKSRYKEEG
jgi:hypothetical protein